MSDFVPKHEPKPIRAARASKDLHIAKGDWIGITEDGKILIMSHETFFAAYKQTGTTAGAAKKPIRTVNRLRSTSDVVTVLRKIAEIEDADGFAPSVPILSVRIDDDRLRGALSARAADTVKRGWTKKIVENGRAHYSVTKEGRAALLTYSPADQKNVLRLSNRG